MRSKKILRTLGLTLFIILALAGVGFVGAPFLPRNRQDYIGKEVTIELMDEKKEDSEKEKA